MTRKQLLSKLIYKIAMIRSKTFIVSEFGKEGWLQFKLQSDEALNEILPQVPDIGKSVFSFSYSFGPCYIAWYKTLVKLQRNNAQVDAMIWKMNDIFISIIPRLLLHSCGKMYIKGIRRKATSHIKKQQRDRLHSFDWKIMYREINKNSFELDITECGLKKLAEQFNVEGMLPGICRMDYLFSHRMGNGFVRNKTLGDGDDCCNCHYDLVGECKWSPQEGFDERK